MQAESLVEQVIKQCRDGRFTGILRIRAKEGDGELRFLSGMRDDVRFGVSTGDEAFDRLLRATNPKFEALARLPGLNGGFKQRLASEGAFGEIRPIDLFRYCESYAITCTLELNCQGKQAVAVYQLGELTALDTDAEGEAAVATMLEASEGSYRFILPPLDLPEGLAAHLSQPPPGVEPLSTDFRPSSAPPSDRERAAPGEEATVLRAEQELKRKAAELAEAQKQPAADARPDEAEVLQKLEEESRRKAQAQAEQARREREEEEKRAAQARAEEARRKADAEEARRKAEVEEARRKAELEAARRKAEDEARRKADEEAREAKRAAEEARRKAEAEALKKKAEAEAEARRKAEAEEAQRKAEAEAEEAQRKAEAAEEAQRRAEAEAETKRKAEAEAERKAAAAAEAERKAEADAQRQKAASKVASAASAGKATAGAALSKREMNSDAALDEEQRLSRDLSKQGRPNLMGLLLIAIVVAALVYFFLFKK
jgi:hypothetical protein